MYIKKILVPTDFSPASLEALKLARYNFPLAEVKVLHVVDEDSPVPDSEANMMLAALGGGELAYGNPAQVMMETIKSWGADLVVMASYEHTGLAQPHYASVAEWMVRESPVPVLTVRASLALSN